MREGLHSDVVCGEARRVSDAHEWNNVVRLTKDGSELQDLTNHSDVSAMATHCQIIHASASARRDRSPFHKDILMPDDRVAHAVRLILRAALLEDEIARNDRALKFERHLCRGEETLCRTDVVQEA